ncbi:MAG: Gldg family protein [Desulfobacteraceae bacterium]
MSTVDKSRSKYIKLFLYLVVIVLLNVAGVTLYFRGDLTKNHVYSLSAVSKQVVSTLTEPLTIEVFFTKDLPAPHNNTEQYLRDMLKEYSLHANKYFNYRFYDVNPESGGIGSADTDDNQQRARDYGISPVQIQMIEQDEVKFKRAFMGLVLIHGDIIERIPALTSTDGLEYKLTTAIQKLNNKVSALLALEDKVKVRLVLSSSIYKVAPYMGLDQLEGYADQIKQIVEKINPKTYNKLDFARIDPTTSPDKAAQIEKLDIMEINWPKIDKAGIDAGSGLIGLLMQYKDKVRVIPLLQVLRLPIFGTQYQLADMAAVEEEINVNLDRLTNINQDIGYLGGYGTLSTGSLGPMAPRNEESLSRFSALINRNYNLKRIDLDEKGIPDGLKCLIIARPTEKMSDYALYQIDQALMRGTNLAIFVDAFKQARPAGQQPFMAAQQFSYVPLDTGLEKLLNYYGVRIKKSVVLDENAYKQRRPPQQGGGEQPIYFAPIIQSEHINKELDYIRNIKGLVAVKISPLELVQKRLDAQGITAYQLFASSDRSWEMRDRIMLNPQFISPPANDTEMASRPLAYLLEGSFGSYFEGKPMPEKPKEGEEIKPSPEERPDLSDISEKGAFRAKSPPAKIFVMASSELLKDQLLDDQGRSTNSMFILNMIDALNDRESIAAMRSKVQQFNPLHETSSMTKSIIKVINIIGLPLLVIAFGLIVWARRHTRRKMIQHQFQTEAN